MTNLIAVLIFCFATLAILSLTVLLLLTTIIVLRKSSQ